MAANSRTPYMPRLEIADEPPWYSSGLSFARARAASAFISFEIAESVFASAWRITGVISPPSIATATPMSEVLEAQDAILRPDRIGGRHALQRRRPGLDDEIVDRELEGGLAVPSLGRRRWPPRAA